ncbi:unnamed protein product, partial [Rotaria sordida]
DSIAECLNYIRTHNYNTIEPNLEAENAWANHVNEVSNMTLYPTVKSWYTGANIEGKPRMFMPYAGGLNVYRQKCKEIVADDYQGFSFAKSSSTPSIEAL